MSPDPATPPAVVVRALDAQDRDLARFPLRHGALLPDELGRRALELVEVVHVDGVPDRGGLVVAVRCTATTSTPVASRPPRREPGLTQAPGEVPTPRQRIAAYAVVVSELGVLLVQYTHRTRAPGWWGLPGGGLDPGERPQEAVHRELAEETGQRVELDGVARVVTDRWIGRAPDGRLEDFHSVRVVYRARCEAPTPPRVHETDGTTAAAAWVTPGEAAHYPLAGRWPQAVSGLLPGWPTG